MQTMSVLAVMRNLRSEVVAGSLKPYSFIEINGLKLASPENIYRVRNYRKYAVCYVCPFPYFLYYLNIMNCQVIYESLSGHRVGWKKALHLLNERFSDGNGVGNEENQPCVLLIDELDLLLTRNQSVITAVYSGQFLCLLLQNNQCAS